MVGEFPFRAYFQYRDDVDELALLSRVSRTVTDAWEEEVTPTSTVHGSAYVTTEYRKFTKKDMFEAIEAAKEHPGDFRESLFNLATFVGPEKTYLNVEVQMLHDGRFVAASGVLPRAGSGQALLDRIEMENRTAFVVPDEHAEESGEGIVYLEPSPPKRKWHEHPWVLVVGGALIGAPLALLVAYLTFLFGWTR